MNRLPHSTIEQWAVLRAIVEHGGFAQAAEALHRSQSSVSYAIVKLQERLGVKLLEHQGRRAVLTMTGTALLAEAIPLIDELTRLEERTHLIAKGDVLHIRLLVDSVFPKDRLFDALQIFATRHPHIEIHLRETVRQTIREIQDEEFDLAILIAEPGAKLIQPIAHVPLIAVAHKDHPLTQATQPPSKVLLARYAHVEIRGMEAVGMSVIEEGKIWRMNTVETAIEGVRRGLCYGWLPYHLIEHDLRDGILAPLPLNVGGTRHIPLGLLVNEHKLMNGPSIKTLASLLSTDTTKGTKSNALNYNDIITNIHL
ncbi:LysR family transcriptional regulator [Saccharibacter sp. 17.LH.SD]|uniref:LysR family transcriptional regulator n=1 Tax=Saccharibacter sp. 17.LH.SD TaxID=2689393 RepID=UPI001369D73D|nr:LysR family transcriptional regulator [Saccharibacter sp. 17.LH.SD]MXV44438.1 LysR family transcriptional regulator [Saccharibacter sp. 17.LH.SD]